ncbi:hypothetical protein HOY80DRAFT_1005729 [Tuber brumale]|nr:hypothetical protein HOY80DRAFT_1005729 [Tuber brumale]
MYDNSTLPYMPYAALGNEGTCSAKGVREVSGHFFTENFRVTGYDQPYTENLSVPGSRPLFKPPEAPPIPNAWLSPTQDNFTFSAAQTDSPVANHKINNLFRAFPHIPPQRTLSIKMCRQITLHFTCLHLREYTCPSTWACNTLDPSSPQATDHQITYRFVQINTECWDCAGIKVKRLQSITQSVGINNYDDGFEAMAILISDSRMDRCSGETTALIQPPVERVMEHRIVGLFQGRLNLNQKLPSSTWNISISIIGEIIS